MFLTKKSFRKIMIMAICYFALGSICIAHWLFFNSIGVTDNTLLILGIVVYLLCALVSICGYFAEGKGKLINLGNKLVRNELKPAEFLNSYLSLKNSKELIVNKPGVEILQLVAVAYDLLDDRENALATVDEMIAIARDEKKAFAKLFKSALLFVYDKKEEAEVLFNETQKLKLDAICNGLVDAILKSDRAMAMGDYKTVEAYNLKMLERTFPKLDKLGKLVVHYELGKVYEILQDNEKAIFYYQYCAENGGETAVKKSAIEKLQYLK